MNSVELFLNKKNLLFALVIKIVYKEKKKYNIVRKKRGR